MARFCSATIAPPAANAALRNRRTSSTGIVRAQLAKDEHGQRDDRSGGEDDAGAIDGGDEQEHGDAEERAAGEIEAPIARRAVTCARAARGGSSRNESSTTGTFTRNTECQPNRVGEKAAERPGRPPRPRP